MYKTWSSVCKKHIHGQVIFRCMDISREESWVNKAQNFIFFFFFSKLNHVYLVPKPSCYVYIVVIQHF